VPTPLPPRRDAVDPHHGPEWERLDEDRHRTRNWKRWGPYLSERQWGTVREDYSATGEAWSSFPHDHARSRAYRWGEDGLLGITDRENRLCFALALWNERDPILKERLFGLTGEEGNHGEDVKECYYYLDSTPTHAYMKALYKYPQAEFPYARLVQENRTRSREAPEFELRDTGVFAGDRYYDVVAEYAKASPDDILIRITVANRGPEAARLHLLPQLWFRNTWSWGRSGEGYWPKPRLERRGDGEIVGEHATLGRFRFAVAPGPDGRRPALLFTDNETNAERLWQATNPTPYVKDAFHRWVVSGERDAVDARGAGTKAAAHYVLDVPAGRSVSVDLRLTADGETTPDPFGTAFDHIFATRREEADAFYAGIIPGTATPEERRVTRQAYAGLLWSKQFYYYVVDEWLDGDPAQPPAPAGRQHGRNAEWTHLYNRDVVSMPDKWEYPWYAAWDLAFHMLPLAHIDPEFAKDQLVLFLREWYMHPNGQMPAYEWAFGDVNPPVHAWAVWRVYKITGSRGHRDRVFLERCFQKLLLNFTWWVNRKDVEGHNIFGGGFLGLDNIGVFDRSRPLPTGGHLEQADGTAWMAFYCTTMLAMALELATENPAYEDMASKFFEHFVAIADAMNRFGGSGLWDEADGFYYDQLHADGFQTPLRIRSLVGVVPLFATEVLEQSVIEKLPAFRKRMHWFLQNRPDLAAHVSYMMRDGHHPDEDGTWHDRRLLAIPSRDRLARVLRYVLDETEFLSPHGVRSVSRVHAERPFSCTVMGEQYTVRYTPAEGDNGLFGGNSNWRGPIWMPLNYLLVESLERYHHFYGDELQVEMPTGSGRMVNLKEVAHELARRLSSLFLPDAGGRRPCHGEDTVYAVDPHWKDLVLFYEYFHGDTGRGVGASHQTGWTALAARLIGQVAQRRAHAADPQSHAEPWFISRSMG
jgi:hypothetical protein